MQGIDRMTTSAENPLGAPVYAGTDFDDLRTQVAIAKLCAIDTDEVRDALKEDFELLSVRSYVFSNSKLERIFF